MTTAHALAAASLRNGSSGARRHNFRAALASPPFWLLLIAAAMVVAPLFVLLALGLKGDAEVWPHLAAHVLPHSLQVTALLLLGTGLLSGAIGIGAAWLVTVYRFPGRNLFAVLLPLPLAIPTYIAAYIYVEVLGPFGPLQVAARALGVPANAPWPEVRSLPGAIVLMSLVLYPYVYLAGRAMFQTQSAALIEVARTLGASRIALVRHVALPLARPALAVGLSLVLLEALNDIGLAEYLGVRTLTLSIYTTWLNRGSLPAAAQIACAMLVIVIALLALERYGRRHRKFAGAAQRQRTATPLPLSRMRGIAAAIACAVPVFLGFVVPVLVLVREVVRRGLLTGFDPDLGRHVLATFVLSAIATVLIVALGVLLAAAVRALRHRSAGAFAVVASLGYAVPGTVLALGLLPLLVGMDRLIAWALALAGAPIPGLIIVGSGAALVIAYVVRFLTIGIGSAQSGLARVSPRMDDVARTLGARPAEVQRRILLPLLRPALGGAALLVFVDCVKELPATLLLRPLNLETLATYVYQFATRGSFEEGALASLLIVAVSILPVFALVRVADAPLAGSRSGGSRRTTASAA